MAYETNMYSCHRCFFQYPIPAPPRSRSPPHAARRDRTRTRPYPRTIYPNTCPNMRPVPRPVGASRAATQRRGLTGTANPATGARKRAHRHRPGAARRRRGGRTEARAAAGPQPSQWAGAGGERTYEPSIMDGRSGERTESERKRTALAPASAQPRRAGSTTDNAQFDVRRTDKLDRTPRDTSRP